MSDKKAILSIDKLLIAFLVIFVVGLVIWFWFGLDIPGKLNLLIPGFNNSQNGEDKNSIENKIYLDDGNGRCKPIKGIYSLKEGKLEVFSGGNWINIDDKIVTEQKVFNKVMKDGLTEAVNNLKLDYNDEEYTVKLTRDGLESNINNISYVYLPPDNLYTRNGLELISLIENGEPKNKILGDSYGLILKAFQKSIEGSMVNIIEFSLNILSDIAVNVNEQSTTSGQPDKITKKIFLYVETGQSKFGNSYGIDYSSKLYHLDSAMALINIGNNKPNLIDDWKDIDDEIAKESEVQFKLLKDELINKCKK